LFLFIFLNILCRLVSVDIVARLLKLVFDRLDVDLPESVVVPEELHGS